MCRLRVPNAPCGVERCVKRFSCDDNCGFLMHRVELKAGQPLEILHALYPFLMHRVELKGLLWRCKILCRQGSQCTVWS